MGGSGYSPKITEMLLEVKSFINIFDSMGVRMVNQSYPPAKNTLAPYRGGVRGVRGTSNEPHF